MRRGAYSHGLKGLDSVNARHCGNLPSRLGNLTRSFVLANSVRSFSDIATRFDPVSVDVVQLLTKIDNSRGREELFRTQRPQVLERLARQTRFDSITASSAIENVVLNDARALALIRGTPAGPYKDRSEEEFAGYRDAVDYLMDKEPEGLTVPLVVHLHRLLMRHTGDPLAGKLKQYDNYIGAEGSGAVIFETVPAGQPTQRALTELVARYEEAVAAGQIPPLLLTSALILDFLAIHPFEEGNGRVARLVTTLELLRHGYGVARYVSTEQRLYDSKNTYYIALRQSQSGWHDSGHDLKPWTLYLLRTIEDAYTDFEQKVAAGTELVGKTKREKARDYILSQAPRRFRLAQIVEALPSISQATIRDALDELRSDGLVTGSRGPAALWERTDPDDG
jgi:Fic family protein